MSSVAVALALLPSVRIEGALENAGRPFLLRLRSLRGTRASYGCRMRTNDASDVKDPEASKELRVQAEINQLGCLAFVVVTLRLRARIRQMSS